MLTSAFVSNVVIVVVLLLILYLLTRPVIRGATYFPTTSHNIELMIKMAALQPGQRVVDLGSGDGRIVVACAKRGICAVGYEINPILVMLSRNAIRRAGLQDYATVYWKSFWGINLGQFDAVFVYGIPRIMNRLARKLENELGPGAKIISNVFKFSDWPPVRAEGKIYLYIRPVKN